MRCTICRLTHSEWSHSLGALSHSDFPFATNCSRLGYSVNRPSSRIKGGKCSASAYLAGSREFHPFIKSSSACSTALSSLDCANAEDARMAAMPVRRVICTFYCDHVPLYPVTSCISMRTRTALNVLPNGCHEVYRNHIRSSYGSR